MTLSVQDLAGQRTQRFQAVNAQVLLIFGPLKEGAVIEQIRVSSEVAIPTGPLLFGAAMMNSRPGSVSEMAAGRQLVEGSGSPPEINVRANDVSEVAVMATVGSGERFLAVLVDTATSNDTSNGYVAVA